MRGWRCRLHRRRWWIFGVRSGGDLNQTKNSIQMNLLLLMAAWRNSPRRSAKFQSRSRVELDEIPNQNSYLEQERQVKNSSTWGSFARGGIVVLIRIMTSREKAVEIMRFQFQHYPRKQLAFEVENSSVQSQDPR